MPSRIQRRRTKGWRAPEGAVYIGRGTRWGNPWAVTFDRTRGWRVHLASDRSLTSDGIVGWWESRARAHEMAVEQFRLHIGPMGLYEYDDDTLAELRRDLAGRDLMCWCPERLPCHADVLLELANPTA